MEMNLQYDKFTLAKIQALGILLGKKAAPGEVITLEGDLGAGKTTLTQSIGRGMDVPEACYITSPTFSLLHEYPGRIPLYHIDLYRLSSTEEITDLGFEDYIYGEGLTVIEWPDRLGNLIPSERLRLNIIITSHDERSITIEPVGSSWEKKLQILKDFI